MRRIRNKKQISILFSTGFFIVNLFFYVLLWTTFFFLLGIHMGKWIFFLAILCSAGTNFFWANRSIKACMIAVFCGMMILTAAMILSCRVYDWSWDGNRYHKAIAGILKWGWNPLRETFYDFAKGYPFLTPISETWYDAYPKMTEIWAACLYLIIDNIEVGKCFNLLGTVAAFCISYEILTQTKLYNVPQTIFCALVCVVNPVVLVQMTTYYVDGFLWQIFLICMVALLYLTFFETGAYRTVCQYLVFVSVCIGVNIKFSALFYFGLLCGSFFCYWTYRKIRNKGWKSGKKWIGTQLAFFAGSAIFGVGIGGITSYGINIFRYRNPVYTMIGEGSTEMITAQLPAYCEELSHISRFLTSLFSETDNNKKLDVVKWKIPFTYNAAEVLAEQNHDTRVAGWGILFSGIFVVSVLVLGYYLIKLKERSMKGDVARLTIMLMSVFALSICVIPGLSWARYNGPLFYIPVAALLCLFGVSNKKNRDTMTPIFTAGVLSAALILNMIPALERIKLDFVEYSGVRTQLFKFKELAESSEEELIVGYTGTGEYRFEGRIFSLYDMGITNFRYGEIAKEDQSGTLFDHGRTLCYRDFRPRTVKEVIATLQDTKNKVLIFAVKDEGSQALTEDFIKAMKKINLDFDLLGQYRASYAAVVVDNAVLYEDLSMEKIDFQIEVGEVPISLTSAGYECGSTASIKIDGREYAVNNRGINVVIYDVEKGMVCDSFCIDTHSGNRISR